MTGIAADASQNTLQARKDFLTEANEDNEGEKTFWNFFVSFATFCSQYFCLHVFASLRIPAFSFPFSAFEASCRESWNSDIGFAKTPKSSVIVTILGPFSRDSRTLSHKLTVG